MDPHEARSLFPLTRHFIFLDHAGVAPMSERARAAVEALTERLDGRPCPEGLAAGAAGQLRTSLAALIGGGPETIRLVADASHAMALLGDALPWRPGDNVVGTPAPGTAGARPWRALAGAGVAYRAVRADGGRTLPEDVLRLVDGRTRVVVLDHVDARTGWRLDAAAVGSALAGQGPIVALDATQSAGALRLDVADLPVDYVAATGSAWLMGPTGIGFCRSRPELQAPRFEESGISVLDVAALQEAVDLLLAVGRDVVQACVLGLARRLVDGLVERGYELAGPWPRTEAESSGIVAFRRPGAPAPQVRRELTAAGIVAHATGDVVRLSPHVTNTPDEIDRVLDVLAPPGAPGPRGPGQLPEDAWLPAPTTTPAR